MFIWDFIADTVLGQIIDWIYGQIVGFLGDFFMQMGNMGADLFEMGWVQSIVLFFSYLAWALYATGLVVAPGLVDVHVHFLHIAGNGNHCRGPGTVLHAHPVFVLYAV